MEPRGKIAAFTFFSAALLSAAVVDRIAVVVDKNVITESEVLLELRLAAFMNGDPLQFGPEQRRDAAERLVDQYLIRKEMVTGGYNTPTDTDVETLLRTVRQQHYPAETDYRAALERYGITEEELKKYVRWQVEALRFTEARFQTNLPDPQSSDSQGANRSENNIDQQMEAWLKEARSQVRIQFKKEAFQ
jgi:parvulin-like peptidyl-prolyl isomerase